jgi:hypothetical protein
METCTLTYELILLQRFRIGECPDNVPYQKVYRLSVKFGNFSICAPVLPYQVFESFVTRFSLIFPFGPPYAVIV